jgi:ankyrin repeat protein
MTEKILSRVTLIFGFLICTVSSALAQESKTCNAFNTYKFYLFDFDEEIFFDCVYADNGRLNLVQDENGSIPIFKALFSDIDSTFFDHFVYALSDDGFEKMATLTDRYGTSLLEIATEAEYLDNLVRLLSLGLNPDQLSYSANNSDVEAPELTVLDARIQDKSLHFAALLKLAGAIPAFPIDLTYSEELAMFGPDNWDEVDYWAFFRSIGSDPQYDQSYCDNLFDPENLKGVTLRLFQPCISGVNSHLQRYANYYDKDGKSFLHLLVENSNEPSLIDLYLGKLDERDRESALDATDVNNYKPIHSVAVFGSNPAILSHLIGWGADINDALPNGISSFDIKRRNWGKRPIHMIAERAEEDAYRMLLRSLSHDAEANAQDEKGNTPLHILLAKDVTDVSSLTLLNFAVFSQRGLLSEVFAQKGLLSMGSDEKRNEKGATPLLYAVSKKRGTENDAFSETSWRHMKIIEDMVDFGADVDATDDVGWSPLVHYAYYGNDADTFNILLSNSEKACKAKTKDGISVIAALNQNQVLKNAELTLDEEVSSPVGLYKSKCKD